MRLIGSQEIDRLLAWAPLVEALADAFRQGGVATPLRHHHPMPRPDGDATLLLMPAWSEGGSGFLGVKVVSVFPGNAARGLPSVLGSYLLMDGDTGAPLAVLDGARLTLWRTAAASALAARYLVRPDAQRMVMVGAGALAGFLVRAHCALRPSIAEVLVWNRQPAKAESLAATLAGEGLPVRAVAALEPAVREADLVSCATMAREPLVQGAWLKDGAHLDLVGAYNLATREADDEALRRASIHIDTAAALTEGGDVALGLRSGAIRHEDVRADLAALCRGDAPGRARQDEITLFKSVGTAIEDLAAAALVWGRS